MASDDETVPELHKNKVAAPNNGPKGGKQDEGGEKTNSDSDGSDDKASDTKTGQDGGKAQMSMVFRIWLFALCFATIYCMLVVCAGAFGVITGAGLTETIGACFHGLGALINATATATGAGVITWLVSCWLLRMLRSGLRPQTLGMLFGFALIAGLVPQVAM